MIGGVSRTKPSSAYPLLALAGQGLGVGRSPAGESAKASILRHGEPPPTGPSP